MKQLDKYLIGLFLNVGGLDPLMTGTLDGKGVEAHFRGKQYQLYTLIIKDDGYGDWEFYIQHKCVTICGYKTKVALTDSRLAGIIGQLVGNMKSHEEVSRYGKV